METTTMNPDPTTSGHTGRDQSPHTPPPFGSQIPLRRPVTDRMAFGVAASLGRYLGVDVTLVRIAFVLLTVIGGAGIPLYLAGLLLIPDEATNTSIASSIVESFQTRR